VCGSPKRIQFPEAVTAGHFSTILRSSNHLLSTTPVSSKIYDCDCTTEGPDGYIDLVLKFDTQKIVTALGGLYDGDELLLTLTGEALDGTPIGGTDCVVIIAKGNKQVVYTIL